VHKVWRRVQGERSQGSGFRVQRLGCRAQGWGSSGVERWGGGAGGIV
jgi:hypothetical protein